jgi:hypothetical protein
MSMPRAAVLLSFAVVIASGAAGPGMTATAAPATEPRHMASHQVQPRTAAAWDDTYSYAGAVSGFGGTNVVSAGLATSSDDTVYVSTPTAGAIDVLAPGQVSGIAMARVTLTVAGTWDQGLSGIAVDQNDDTVYVVNRGYDPMTLWAINGRTLAIDDSAALPCASSSTHNGLNIRGIAVNSQTNTVYVPCFEGSSPRGNIAAISGVNLDDSAVYRFGADQGFRRLAVHPGNGRVYASAEWGPSIVRQFDDTAPPTADPPLTLTRTFTGANLGDPSGVTILDDSVYVTNQNNFLSAFSFTGASSASVDLGFNELRDVAGFAPLNLLFVVTNNERLAVVSAPDLTLRQTFAGGNYASSVAVSSAGVVYVGTKDAGNVKVYVPARPSPPSTIAGTAGYEQVSTSWSTPSFTGNVNWYKVTASPGGASCIAQAPATTCVVDGLTAGTPYTFKVQAANSAGTWGDPSAASAPVTPLAPTPPAYPPTAPRDVTAVPGDGQATVSWQAPESAGSFPVTNYQVRTSPGGATCLVAAPATSCNIGGLTNGTAYTFEVQALNGAGWGAWSVASAPVTPGGSATPSILIIDSRRGTGPDAGRVYASGTSKQLTSATVQTRVKLTGEIEYQDGVVRLLDTDGDFAWTRRTNKRVHVYYQADGVRSNRVIIAAR